VATAATPEALSRHLERIEAALRDSLADGPAELIDIGRYVMGWQSLDGTPMTTGGKRIRPALCVFAAELFGAPAEVAMPGAVAVELIHNFSLVHDEVQDKDAERHHRPTVWAIHGEGQAINAGDFLITRAFAALLEGQGPPGRRLAALEVLNEAMGRMIAGQWSDIAFESRDSIAPDEYLEMVRGKTGALLGAPLAMGALLAGAAVEQARLLQSWGETVGLAFQVHDDYLGIWGNPDLTGKSNTNDILRRKKTLPVVFGLSHDPDGIIAGVYRQKSVDASDVPKVASVLEQAGAREYARGMGAKLVSEADEMLDAFELPGTSRSALREIGAYLVDRDR
jgi:geranylgeranyl diphosphate synthase type I